MPDRSSCVLDPYFVLLGSILFVDARTQSCSLESMTEYYMTPLRLRTEKDFGSGHKDFGVKIGVARGVLIGVVVVVLSRATKNRSLLQSRWLIHLRR